MLKCWLFAFLLFIITMQPLAAGDIQPFFAVFANPKWAKDFEKYKPDMIVSAFDWEVSFPYFIKMIKERAGNRPIVIDIDCHGLPNGGLFLEDPFTDELHEANSGYILNELKTVPNLKKVYLEACYSGVGIVKGLYRFPRRNLDGDRIEPWQGTPLTYKLYGIGPSTNYSGLVYMQDRYHKYIEFWDLGDLLDKPPMKVDRRDRRDLWALFVLLSSIS